MTKIKVAALQMPTVHDKMENVKAVGSYLEQLKDENDGTKEDTQG